MFDLPSIGGSVHSTSPFSSVREVRHGSIDQFGNINDISGKVGHLDQFLNVKDIAGRIIGHLNQFGTIEPR